MWLSSIVGSRPRRRGEWEELTPGARVEHAWRSHRERAGLTAIVDLIFAVLGVVYRLLLGGAIAPSAAALVTPAAVHRTAAPPAERSPEQPEHQQQHDTAPPFLGRVRSCKSAETLLTPCPAPPYLEGRSPEQPKHQQREAMEPPVPQRARRHSSQGSFSPLAREVLQRKMLECWGNTPKFVHEYTVEAPLGR